jgi:hypothetical protein
MTVVFKSIRYGTALKPSIVHRVCCKFSSHSDAPLMDPSTLTNGTRLFANIKAFVRFKQLKFEFFFQSSRY